MLSTCWWCSCGMLQVQTLGLMAHLKSKGIHGPFMIVGPLNTLSNWVNETQQFLPSLPPLLYHGSKQERAELREKHLTRRKCMPALLLGDLSVACASTNLDTLLPIHMEVRHISLYYEL